MIIIVIANYNSSQYIDRCLDSCGDFPVIIVDNYSSDSSLNQILDRNDSRICLIKNESNLGFGQANNIGINKALSEGAEYVLLLNQDAYLEKDCVEKLIEVHKANSNYGVLSPIHYNGSGTNLDRNFSEYLKGISSGNLLFDLLRGSVKKVYSLPFVNAAAWLIPKSTIERVGLFDSMFFHYGEDENYCQRVRYHGLKIGVVPKATIRHDRDDRLNSINPQSVDIELIKRRLKIQLGDLNFTPDYKSLKRIWRNRIIMYSLRLNFKKVMFSFQVWTLLNKLIPQMIDSRNRNDKL